ncbi:glycosyltransferase [Nesterenkonia muleiensis]|uniref:glycosyltransferase n=1 Tax=Nesterenkonia muleiensis TaxID=2282648 RepID=UPI000E75B2B9|nr:glycosyltransferase [Nesterenkonia muleiensis]
MDVLTALRRRTLGAARRVRKLVRRQTAPAPTRASPEEASAALFVGHTRFSVHQFGSRYFNATREGQAGAGFTEDQYTAWLYSDERLNPRTEIFTQLSLPQLAEAAKDFNVVHYVSYSPSLPQRHKDALLAAAERYDFLELNETERTVSSTPVNSLIRRAAQKHGFESGAIGVYRLDDDDVLSVNYFHLMAPYVRSSHIGWWASQGRGVAGIRVGDEYVYVRDYYYPKSAFGPLCIAGYDQGDVTHTRAPKHTIMDHTNPTILDSREPAYFHIRHRGQDSTLGGKPMPFYPEAMMRIRSQGPADLKQVQTLFPLLADKLHLTPGREQEATDVASSPFTVTQEPVTFGWEQPGSIALRLELEEGRKLTPQQVRVLFSTEQDEGCEYSPEQEREFFAAAKVQSEHRGYWTWMPHQSTGLGHLLVIEPPEGVQVKSLSLQAEHGETLDILRLTAYPL